MRSPRAHAIKDTSPIFTAGRPRGYLPHWEADDAIYFITYRLADSLPQAVVNRIREQYRADRARGMTGPMASRRLSRRMNKYLRAGSGECLLRDSAVATLTIDTWRHFDGERYRLICDRATLSRL